MLIAGLPPAWWKENTPGSPGGFVFLVFSGLTSSPAPQAPAVHTHVSHALSRETHAEGMAPLSSLPCGRRLYRPSPLRLPGTGVWASLARIRVAEIVAGERGDRARRYRRGECRRLRPRSPTSACPGFGWVAPQNYRVSRAHGWSWSSELVPKMDEIWEGLPSGVRSPALDARSGWSPSCEPSSPAQQRQRDGDPTGA